MARGFDRLTTTFRFFLIRLLLKRDKYWTQLGNTPSFHSGNGLKVSKLKASVADRIQSRPGKLP